MPLMKILLLEDDPILSEIIEEFLVEHGLHVKLFYDGKTALDAIFEHKFDLLLLDINVPSLNGFELLKEIKNARITTPVIFITSLDQISDVKKGFALGAEDYLKKPFDLEELLVRIERTKKLHNIDTNERITLTNDLFFDPSNYEIITPETSYKLRKKEAQLLEYFLKHKNRVLSFEEIIEEVWRFEEVPTYATVRTYIKNLRSYGLEALIENTKGVGYVFKPL
ncbi:Response regulator MprA [Sulfurospirillum diekertiae]|uniref:Response regulator MprA n=2 Tax=Sulfurospirillum diekertiae TaxID=1854492 RepID=A0A1Y0HR30_9BACT|nr:Response regulator MprA [Sulfurospirillum diekertiae]ASC94785.1 Response regulator MprA [Sulfurospirillum diekertiae]